MLAAFLRLVEGSGSSRCGTLTVQATHPSSFHSTYIHTDSAYQMETAFLLTKGRGERRLLAEVASELG